MPNIQSAKKRVLITERKNMENRVILSRIKTIKKKFYLAINEDKKEEAKVLMLETTSEIDRAYHKGLMHINKASRLKSQLAVAYNNIDKLAEKAKKEKEAQLLKKGGKKAVAKAEVAKKAEKEVEAPKAEEAPAKKPAVKKTTTKKATKAAE